MKESQMTNKRISAVFVRLSSNTCFDVDIGIAGVYIYLKDMRDNKTQQIKITNNSLNVKKNL